MHVVATAGHVDHGKSTLVRLLTGMEPDRWAEERRRGLTIDLGFAWTVLPGDGAAGASSTTGASAGTEIAFVDVPGHERFVPNMLAGVGPVPAVMIVVAADEGWMPQSAEHLAALDALRVRHGLLVVSRSDLADPGHARAAALRHIAGTSLGEVPAVAVSGRTGEGVGELRAALTELVQRLPAADVGADVRLWVDRSFTIGGAGTVVTGTLPAGTLRTGEELVLASTGQRVRVRGLQALGRPVDSASGVARVAVNLRGVDRRSVARGDALLTPDAWLPTTVLDAAWSPAADEVPSQVVLHVGSAAVPARVRPLGAGVLRVSLAAALPLRVGDRVLLRDPGQHRVVGGATVLDVRPPALTRRGTARARAEALAAGPAGATVEQLRHRGFVRAAELRAMGLPLPPGQPRAGDWYVEPRRWQELIAQVGAVLEEWQREHPLEAGMPADALRQRLGLPDPALLTPVVSAAGLVSRLGRVQRPDAPAALPARLEAALGELAAELAQAPFAAPDSNRLAELGLGARELAAAVRAGRLVKIADGVVLLPGAIERAVRVLATVEQPFTLSRARQALGTTRRVAVPLLELLDRRRITEQLPDSTRRLRAAR